MSAPKTAHLAEVSPRHADGLALAPGAACYLLNPPYRGKVPVRSDPGFRLITVDLVTIGRIRDAPQDEGLRVWARGHGTPLWTLDAAASHSAALATLGYQLAQ